MKSRISFMAGVAAWLIVVVWTPSSQAATDTSECLALSQMADSHFVAEQYDSAVVEYQRALECLGSGTGELPSDTLRLTIQLNLARSWFEQRQFATADSIWQGCLELARRHFDDSNPRVLDCLRWLGHVTIYLADYARAETYLQEAIAAWEQSVEADTSYILRTYLRLGVICMNQNRLEDAEAAYTTALNMIEADPSRHPRLSAALRNNLSNMYRWQGRQDKAEPLLVAQIEQIEAMAEPYVDILLAAYHNLAEVYSDLEQFDRAEEYFRMTIKRNRELKGDDHTNIAYAMTSLGNLLVKMHRFDDAATEYAEALRRKRGMVGLADRSVANTLAMYSQCQRARGEYASAVELASEAFAIRHASFRRNAWTLTEDRALTFSSTMRHTADAYLGPYLDGGSWPDSVTDRAAGIILSAKGQVSDGVFKRRLAVSLQADSTLTDLLAGYRSAMEALSKLYRQGPGEGDPVVFQARVDSIGDKVQQLEKTLAISSNRFSEMKQQSEISAERVSTLIPSEATLVEYYRHQSRNMATDSTCSGYLALVLRPTARPAIIDLGNAEPIDSAVARYRLLLSEVGRTWPAATNELDRSLQSQAQELYRRLLLPLGLEWDTTGLLLVAPDGPLNLLSFATLVDDSGRYLIERSRVHYLSAGRDILRLQPRPSVGVGLLAMGDVDYDAAWQDQLLAGDLSSVTTVSEDSSAPQRRSDDWPLLVRLPYTGREVKRVARVWSYDADPLVLTGAAASEASFKRLSKGRRTLHLATHGFFEPYDSAAADNSSAGENPLLRSGLYLSGANLLPGNAGEEAEDGHLTAWEVTGLDLSGVEWVVLSACESGLGRVQTGEGVYGLRRAFQMAGAATVISSLWSIPDKQTAALMEKLYSSSEMDLAKRLRSLALDRIIRQREQGLGDNPYLWGAFVAQGAWQMGSVD